MILKFHAERLSLLLLLLGSMSALDASEQRLATMQAGGCEVSLHGRTGASVLRLRVRPPGNAACVPDASRIEALLRSAVESKALEGRGVVYDSLFIGRLIRFAGMSGDLARAAMEDAGWNAKHGRPVSGHENTYVAAVLSRAAFLAPFQRGLAGSAYRVRKVYVEKVLIGEVSMMPVFTGPSKKGRFPFDAQVWLRLEPAPGSGKP